MLAVGGPDAIGCASHPTPTLTEAATIRRLFLPSALSLALIPIVATPVDAGLTRFSGARSASAPAGFAAAGSLAWTNDAEWLLGPQAVFMGLTASGWGWSDPFGSAPLGSAGLLEAAPPSAWSDSISVRMGGMGAVDGFAASLARLESHVEQPASRKARAMFTLLNGASAVDHNGLLIAKGDDRAWFRGGSHGARRSELGSMGLSGEHLWFASGGTIRGDHESSARYTQTGYGNEQAVGGVREGGRGENGEAQWRWSSASRSMRVQAIRSHEGRGSRGHGILFAESRRDAATNQGTIEVADSMTLGRLSLALTLGSERVVRVTPGSSEPRREWKAGRWWSSLGLERELAGGRLAASLGGGRHSAPERAAERWQLAPSIEWHRPSERWDARVFAERTITPVWSDLEPSTPAFMQDVWWSGAEAGVGASDGTWAKAVVSFGRVHQRATLVRYPVRDLALRLGWQRDADLSTLSLLSLSSGAHLGPVALDASAFVQGRPSDSGQPSVDPGMGGTAGAEGAVRLFQGDLAVRLRLQMAVVGERDLEYTVYDGVDPLRLPAYATFGAHLRATLGDATLGIRVTNLEDRRRLQVWIDPATGAPALDVGRHLTFEIVWPLFD